MVAPILWQRRSRDGLVQQFAIVAIIGENVVHLGDRNGRRFLTENFEGVSSGNDSLPFHRKIEPAAAAPQKARQNVVALKLGRQLVAGDPRLPHYDNG